MKRFRSGAMGLGLLTLALVITGCSFLGYPTGQDRVEADTLQDEIANYREWDTPDWVEGLQPTVHPVPSFVRYYVNDIGMQDIDELAPGSIIVKEQYDENQELMNLTVMKRIAGYNPEHGDWFWAIADTNGQWENAGRLNSWYTSACIDCHERGDGGGDLVFIND